jgi:hypothetical protein
VFVYLDTEVEYFEAERLGNWTDGVNAGLLPILLELF